MSVRVMAWVWEYAQVKSGTLLVLLALADFAHDDGGGAYPSMDTLARKARLEVRHTQAVVKRLEGMGYIRVDYAEGPHNVNVYTVLMTLPLNTEMHPAKNAGGAGHDSPGVHSNEKEGAMEDTPPPQSSASDPSSEPSLSKPPEEPSLNVTLPTWWITLSKDKRWGSEVDRDFIRDIDSFFGHLELAMEARKCFQWLKDTVKGRSRKDIRRTWLNWAEKAAKDVEEQGTTKQPRSAAAPVFDPVALALLERQDEALTLWEQASDVLRGKFSTPSFKTWIEDLEPMGFLDESLVLKAGSPFVAKYLYERMLGYIENAVGCRVALHVEAKET